MMFDGPTIGIPSEATGRRHAVALTIREDARDGM